MRLPRDVTGDQAVRALRRLGFREVRQTGSHRILKGSIEQAGLTVEEFAAEL